MAFFAVTRVGAIAVPLSTFYRPGELQKVLRLADIHTLLLGPTMFGASQSEALEAAIPGLRDASTQALFLSSVPALRAIWIWGPAERAWSSSFDPSLGVDTPVSDELVSQMEAEVAPADLAILIHTSGTSADPKGVFHTHGAVVRHSHQFSRWGAPVPPQRYVGPGERTFSPQAFFWVAGLMQDLLAMLHVGGTLLVQDKFDADALLGLLRRERATRIATSAFSRIESRPAMLQELSEMENLRLPSVDGRRRHGGCGMTETLANHCHPQDEFDRILPGDLVGSSGKPVPFMQHRIVDPDTNMDLPEGTPGMLLVRGYALMAGLNKKERDEVFDEDGWYRTGDRCLFRDGYLFFVDRYNEMIKTSGANVSPPEVERVLLAMATVIFAVVLGIPDPGRGQIVAAALTAKPGIHIDVADILPELRTHLSSFKVPKKILIFDDEDLPRLANGKPDKRMLSQLLEEAPELPVPHSASLPN